MLPLSQITKIVCRQMCLVLAGTHFTLTELSPPEIVFYLATEVSA